MSKYYKAEDVDLVCIKNFANGDVLNAIRSLPTIEVSEDCISKHDIWKIIEDNAYWVRYNENSTEKGMTLTGINQALNECPTVIPTVSEDCISRADLIESFLADSECKREEAKACMCSIDFMLELIETAPSVIPTTEPQMEYKKWETPPKVKNEGIITTCVGVPMASIEDESQKESEDVE